MIKRPDRRRTSELDSRSTMTRLTCVLSGSAGASTAPTAWSELPLDCLETITDFLRMRDFAAVATHVCRGWSLTCGEVSSRSDAVSLSWGHLLHLRLSPLHRHVATLQLDADQPHLTLTQESLLLLTTHMPQLTGLTAVLACTLHVDRPRFTFPPELRHVDLTLCIRVGHKDRHSDRTNQYETLERISFLPTCCSHSRCCVTRSPRCT